ncbi:MAG: 2-polyprenyl-3-methyl-6-methoxy-1,4-benzoquinone monooxygenase [Gammaproteobacteria bacterium]|nr:2-polyprenyl-3-methyl-6-methoxy-1,4-benzoquinone monooxygenase [Gammaproteobacteria bacterium]
MFRDLLDEIIQVVDSGLRTLTATHQESFDNSKFPAETELSPRNRRAAASIMRINHCGEVCAQALYEGQALTARTPSVQRQLKQAAAEEREHLALCRTRLNELDANPSILEPFFYAASAGIGAIAGQLGDQISLGFVEATEDEVCKHLDRHIAELNDEDQRTKAMLESIRADEAQHRLAARDHGGIVFSKPIKAGMALAAKVMTRTTAIV